MGVKNIYERLSGLMTGSGRRISNTTSLAKQFEISVKTAQRDIEFMRDRLNCPLQYDSSLKGYFTSASPPYSEDDRKMGEKNQLFIPRKKPFPPDDADMEAPRTMANPKTINTISSHSLSSFFH